MTDDPNKPDSADTAHLPEHILVCVSYGPSSERLIRRGDKLADAFHAPLTILTVDPLGNNRYSEQKEQNFARWEALAQELQGQFVVAESRDRNVVQVIADVAREKRVTQIVLGQSPPSRWEEITQGSIVNEILRQLERVDVHVVSVQRHAPEKSEEYESGVVAYLVKEADRHVLQFDAPSGDAIKGIFYRNVNTDFNSGVFKSTEEDNPVRYRVSDGAVRGNVREN